MAGAIQDNLFIGRRAQELRGLLKIKYPMEHGVVTDWDDMERIWGWVYAEGLKALSEEVGSGRGRTVLSVHVGASQLLRRYVASRAVDRGAIESTTKQGCCSADLLRDVQRPSILHQRAGGAKSVSDIALGRAPPCLIESFA
jgi:hypothetical protein